MHNESVEVEVDESQVQAREDLELYRPKSLKEPEPVTKQHADISGYTLVRRGNGDFALIGKVSNHPRQHEFRCAVQETSKVILFDEVNGVAETENTVYRLVKPESVAAPANPDAAV